MANTLALHVSGVESASGTGASTDIGALRTVARLLLDVTVLVGSCKVEIQDSLTGVDWKTAKSFETISAIGAREMLVVGLRRYVRAKWTLTGDGAAATFALSGTARDTYCTPADLGRVVKSSAIEETSLDARWLACIVGSDEADGYFASGYTLPLLAWDDATRLHVARIAVAELFSQRGVDPQGPDANVLLERDRAIKWLGRIAAGQLQPPGIVDSTTESFEGGSVVVSATPRGW
jgi:phage gp36-like protein